MHRSFAWLRTTAILLVLGAVMTSGGLWAAGPGLTTISDTVYRADGTPAAGTALISWPAFVTSEGKAVAAGNKGVKIGTGGAFSTDLAANVGAIPAGTYYTVVFQLDDKTVRTEYWAVGTTSPMTIAAARTTPGTGAANGLVSKQYVDAAVANRAVDVAVVHLAGAEMINGTKQFAAPPAVPTPTGATDAVNKAYVDAAVTNVGAGNYVAKTGDTMSGPLTLAGDPVAVNQAATRHYVDTGLAAKASLVNGVVPASQGGTPPGIRYATTSLNWSQTISGTLSAGVQATVTLTPCPVGVDTTSGAGYQVLIAGGGNSEAVNVISSAGGCTSGAASGTIKFTPYYSYSSGYTIGSASSGIQETLNDACGVDATTWKNGQCNVTIPANGPNKSLNTYSVPGTIYLHSNQSTLSGYGASLACTGRGACLQVGNLSNSNSYMNNTVAGLSFQSPISRATDAAFSGVAITQTQRASQVVTITTASAHDFRVGDMVTILFTDSNAYWGDAVVTAVPSSTTFQYAHSGVDIASQNTPGVVALAYVAVRDNAMNSHFVDISYDFAGEIGQFNNFFDFWDDENALVEHFNNNAISLNQGANWTGSFIFSAGNQSAPQQIAPVITVRDSTITANYSNGATVYNSNGVYIENTVIQATGPWQLYSSNTTGNYQGAYLKNIYSETSINSNPVSPVRSPFAGTGVAGLIAGPSSGAANFAIAGASGVQGFFQTAGSGSTAYSYFIVAKDTTSGTQTSPMQVANYNSTGSDSITVRWPRVANGADNISYDVIRTATPIGVGAVYPFAGGCNGGSTNACGSVAINLAQCAGLVCTYTDSGSATTAAYTILQGNYGGNMVFWPGSIVSVNKSVAVDVEHANGVGVGLTGNALQVARQCSVYGATSAGGYTACPSSLTSSNNSVPNQTATLMSDGGSAGGGMTLTKGRLNFSTSPWAVVQPHHIITLIDSESAKTRATAGYRPPASANDTWIGTDVSTAGVGTTQGQLAFGAPVSITNYIAATGDGTTQNWKERLNATLKEFNVPVKFDQNVTISGLANGCLNLASGVIGSTGSPCGSGGGGSGITSLNGLTGSAQSFAQTNDTNVTLGINSAGTTHTFAMGWTGLLAAARGGTGVSDFSFSGNTNKAVTLSGTTTNGDCAKFDASGNLTDAGAACGSGGGAVSSIFGRTGAVVAASGDYSVAQVTGAAADAGVAHNSGAETISGAKTFTNDVTMNGNLNIAGTIVQTGAGPWSTEGAYGTMTAAVAGKSKIGFSTNGRLAVSENAGAVTEVAKNYPQQFTYTFFDANNLLTTALVVPSIYVNRSAALHIVEVYCEIDGGSATINLQTGGANILSSDLACSTAGATTNLFVAGKDAVAVGSKVGHVTTTATGTLHRMNVVVKYTVD